MADNKVNSGLLEFSEDQKVFVALDAETSEVQKAVTIDGDGVETDIQGVQPSGKKEITSTAEVNVANYATAQVVDEDLVAGNIKKDVDILGVVGTYEPAAPASDFITAEVKVVNNVTGGTTEATTINVNIILYEYHNNDIDYDFCTGFYLDESTGVTTAPTDAITVEPSHNIDLPKLNILDGKNMVLVCGAMVGIELTATNNMEIIEIDSTPAVIITGDCTITATATANAN